MEKEKSLGDQQSEELLVAPAVGRVIGSSTSMAYKLMAAGTLPTVRLGRSVRVPRRALMRWIEVNTRGGGE